MNRVYRTLADPRLNWNEKSAEHSFEWSTHIPILGSPTMTPMILDSDADDDFVRTISDNDENFPSSGEEIVINSAPQGKKRKRNALRELAEGFSEEQRRHHKQEGKKMKPPKDSISNGNVGLEEEETWYAQGEDDGTMDSNFEFQIGTLETGVVEGFDGWEDEDGVSKSSAWKSGNKKSVDIDELIVRRRKVDSGTKLSNGDGDQLEDQDGSEDDGLDLEEEEEEEGDEDEDTTSDEKDPGDEGDENDETVAEDTFGMGAELNTEGEDTGGENSVRAVEESDSENEEAVADAMPDPKDLEEDSEEVDDAEELAKREAFFAPEEPDSKVNAKEASSSKAFQSMNLSRPILRGLASVGFTNPTPIQKKTIPVALLAKDVVGGAVTGSGKTGAFIIPILERLLHRPKKVPTSRVAILMPTRELAVQCFNVANRLANFTDITFALVTGGFSLREQESVLRSRPDIIIATPGRFIDHMRNSPSFTIDTLEILILDEADRMLEDGFADELNEILTTIPRSRQTMLFSATMTDRVDKLIRVGLNRPVKIMVDLRKQTVVTLTQEFVRLRPGREDKRLGYLAHLCSDVFTERVIVFFRQKREVHRVRIIFGLLGIKAAELHGSMSQEEVSKSLGPFSPNLC